MECDFKFASKERRLLYDSIDEIDARNSKLFTLYKIIFSKLKDFPKSPSPLISPLPSAAANLVTIFLKNVFLFYQLQIYLIHLFSLLD